MDRHDDSELTRDLDTTTADGETHASTGGAAVAGAVTGGVIGLTGGPIGAVVGAVGGAIVGAAAERMMHGDDDADHDHVGVVDNGGRHRRHGSVAADVTAAWSTAALTDERVFRDREDDTER